MRELSGRRREDGGWGAGRDLVAESGALIDVAKRIGSSVAGPGAYSRQATMSAAAPAAAGEGVARHPSIVCGCLPETVRPLGPVCAQHVREHAAPVLNRLHHVPIHQPSVVGWVLSQVYHAVLLKHGVPHALWPPDRRAHFVALLGKLHVWQPCGRGLRVEAISLSDVLMVLICRGRRLDDVTEEFARGVVQLGKALLRSGSAAHVRALIQGDGRHLHPLMTRVVHVIDSVERVA